jgi:hypothetical protein
VLIQVGNPKEHLLTVYAIDFNDNFHRLDTEASSELEKQARKIRRRYREFSEYQKAIEVYQEYMAYLIIKHGGFKIFEAKLKSEAIDDFIPAKPRLKNTKMNKFIMKHGIVLSSTKELQIDDDIIKESIDKVDPNNVQVLAEAAKKSEAENFLDYNFGEKLASKKLEAIDNLDYLNEYFYGKNQQKEKEKEKEYADLSLSKIMKSNYVDYLPEDTTERDTIINYKGAYLNQEAIEELKVFENLSQYGWNSLKLMKRKNISSRITNILKGKQKKEKKKDKKRDKNDDFIVKIVTDNNYDDFSSFQEDMLNFTSSNIFK